VSRRADPRQQSFWPQPSSPAPDKAPQGTPEGAGRPSLPLPPPALTSVAPEAAPDQSEALADIERTARVFSRLLPLLRQLKERAEAAAAATHNCRILSGDPQITTQDATDENKQDSAKKLLKFRHSDARSNEPGEELPAPLPRSNTRAPARDARGPSADLEEDQ